MIASAPILAELARAGFRFETLNALRTSGIQYTAAIPILLNRLPKVEDNSVRQSIAMLLAVPWAKPIAAATLICELDRGGNVNDDYTRWCLSNALAITADETVTEDVIRLARNTRLGKAREMVVLALGKLHDRRAVDTLLQLLADDAVAGHAISALGKLRASRAAPSIEAFLTHPMDWVRTEAAKALRSIKHRPTKTI